MNVVFVIDSHFDTVIFFVLFDFADLEDIQRKRRKQIPSFSNNDSFMTVSGLLALLLFNLLITVSH